MSVQKVDDLTRRLNETEPLGARKRDALYKAFSQRVSETMLDNGVSWGQAAGLQHIYDEDSRQRDQDLSWQCDTVSTFFSHHLETGDIVPSHFPKRIAILLRKAEETEREREFLAAWYRHFGPDGWFGDRLRRLSRHPVDRQRP